MTLPDILIQNIANEEKETQAYLSSIRKSTNAEFTMNVNYEDLYKCSEGCPYESDRLTLATLANKYLSRISTEVEYMQSAYIEALLEVCHKREIQFHIGEIEGKTYSPYGQFKMEDGVFKIIVPKAYLGWNTNDVLVIRKALDEMTSHYPISVIQALRDIEPKLKEYEEQLKQCFGMELKLIYDGKAMYTHPDLINDNKTQFAPMVEQYFGSVTHELKSMVEHNSLYIELIKKLIHHGEIILQYGTAEAKSYGTNWEVQNGRLVYNRLAKSFKSIGFHYSAEGLKKVIDDANAGMSVNYIASMNKADAEMGQILDGFYKAIGQHIHIVGLDWEEIYENDRPKVPEEWRETIPEIIINSYMSHLVSDIRMYCRGAYDKLSQQESKDRIARLLRCWTTGIFRWKFGPVKVHNSDTCYGEYTFDNGDLLFLLPWEHFNFNVTWVGSFGLNVLIKRVIEEEKKWIEQSGWKRPFCDICDENTEPATHKCVECEDCLCEMHVQSHQKGKKTKDHDLQTIELTIPSQIIETKYCDACDEKVEALMYCGECEEHLCEFHIHEHKKSRKTKNHELVKPHLIGVNVESTEDVSLQKQLLDDGIDRVNEISNVKKKVPVELLERIYGRIKLVKSFPDYKVQIVNSSADLSVQRVNTFADKAGKWKIVDSLPDYKIQIVKAFPDFTIQFVDAFPGVN